MRELNAAGSLNALRRLLCDLPCHSVPPTLLLRAATAHRATLGLFLDRIRVLRHGVVGIMDVAEHQRQPLRKLIHQRFNISGMCLECFALLLLNDLKNFLCELQRFNNAPTPSRRTWIVILYTENGALLACSNLIVSQSSVILFPQHSRACDAFGSLVQLGRADFDQAIDGKLEHLRHGRIGGRESDIAL